MKISTFVALAIAGLAAAPSALAFPALARMSADEVNAYAKRFMDQDDKMQQEKRLAGNLLGPIPTIGRKNIPDADHPFKAPSATAQRGPCPGLNIMANYGYIDREGIATFGELVYGQQEFMGWAADLAIFLAAIAVALDGNVVNQKVSIGGPDDRVGTIPLVGGSQIPGGILKHNAYEIDSSLTRVDKAIGDNKRLNGTLFQQIWDVADEMNGGTINAPVMTKVRSLRYEQSVRDNPQFTFAPIGTLFLGADHFLWNTMVSSNEDGEPGPSTRETLSAFYGAKSTGPNTWEYVPEQLPGEGNWFRRARPLTIPEAVLNAKGSLVDAVAKGQLPTGISPASVQSPEAFKCAIKNVVLGTMPASLLGIDAVGAFLTMAGDVLSGC